MSKTESDSIMIKIELEPASDVLVRQMDFHCLANGGQRSTLMRKTPNLNRKLGFMIFIKGER